MKTMLSDAESREEHNETKCSPIGTNDSGVMDFVSLNVGEITGKE